MKDYISNNDDDLSEKSENVKIDFVVTFVDDSDPVWQNKRNDFLDEPVDYLNKRFRSWDNLRYWFRCVAKYAPWVHKIYLVTDDQTPEWLNLENEKIVAVNHSDFIPKQYLPVFSANPIETNLHRINGLEECFVFFNDDTFICAPVSPDFFFKNGFPCDYPVESPYGAKDPSFSHILHNDIMLINSKYDRLEVLKKYKNVFYSHSYKAGMKKNLYFSLNRSRSFFGFENLHLPSCMLKSAYYSCWEEFGDELDNTCHNRFRSDDDVNQYVFSYWLYTHGKVSPIDWRKETISIQLNDSNSAKNNVYKAANHIIRQSKKLICLNDANVSDFESTKTIINKAFEIVVPDLCEFEKGYVGVGEHVPEI